MKNWALGFVLLSFFSLLLCSPAVIFSQQRWEMTYGGMGIDYGESVRQTADGGYIVAGIYDYLGSDPQVYLIKTNATGDTLWTRTYGGTGDDYGYSVQQTSDSGYIVAGHTNSFGNTNQVYLVKTNAFGDTLWSRTYGGPNGDAGYSVQQTADGGYIIAGTTASFGMGFDDVYLIKTNAFGDTLWTRTYGGSDNDMGSSVQQTSDGGYIVAGSTHSFGAGNPDIYLVKTDAQGDTLWTKTYGDTAGEFGCSVQQTSDGGYIVAGYTVSYVSDVYLIKTNSLGDTLWTRTYGGPFDDVGYSVQQTTDGGYIVAGWTYSFGAGNSDIYLVKTDAQGDTLWTKTYGGTNGDFGFSAQQTSDHGYIMTGYTWSYGIGYSDVYLIKTDANGNVGVEQTAGVRDQGLGIRITATPNPFTSFTTLPGHSSDRFALYDISGRRVGVYRGDRIGANVPQGVYFLRAESGGAKPVRIVKVR